MGLFMTFFTVGTVGTLHGVTLMMRVRLTIRPPPAARPRARARPTSQPAATANPDTLIHSHPFSPPPSPPTRPTRSHSPPLSTIVTSCDRTCALTGQEERRSLSGARDDVEVGGESAIRRGSLARQLWQGCPCSFGECTGQERESDRVRVCATSVRSTVDLALVSQAKGDPSCYRIARITNGMLVVYLTMRGCYTYKSGLSPGPTTDGTSGKAVDGGAGQR